MQVGPEVESLEDVDPAEYVKQKEEYEEIRDKFMRKHLLRSWPKRVVCMLGIFQLLISLAVLGVDLPIILMFGPRWQVFAGCWAFVIEFIACVSTFHTTRKLTWLKLQWAVGFNLLGGLAAGVMTAFDVLYLTNPYICLAIGGCNYLPYTYAAAKNFYTVQIVLGIFLIIAAFLFLVLFIKYGIGGATLYDDIQKGWVPVDRQPIVQSNGMSTPINPAVGPQMTNVLPAGPMKIPGPRGPMMVSGPRGPMIVSGPRGPMMAPGPRGPMMAPGPRGFIRVPYGHQPAYPSHYPN